MSTETRTVYLATWAHGSGDPINHGQVRMNDKGYVNGETPVEDFGMFMFRESRPFGTPAHIAKMFIRLMERGEL